MMMTPAAKEKLAPQAEAECAAKIPYSYLVDAETIETKSGHLLQTIKIDGLLFETLDDELIDHEKHICNTLLKSLADSSTSLYFHTIRKKETRTLTGTYRSSFAQKLHDKWQAYLAKKKFFINEHYITVVKKPPIGKIRRFADLVKTFSTKVDQKARDIYRQKSHQELNKITNRIMTTLAHYGVKKLAMGKDEKTGQSFSELLSFLSRLINLSDRNMVPPSIDLAHFLSYKRLFFDSQNGTMALRDIHNKSSYAAILSIKDYCSNSRAGLIDGLLDVPAEMIITQSFNFLDKRNAREKMKEQMRNQEQSDDGETSESQKIGESLDELGSGTTVSGEHHLSILCQGDSISELDANVSIIDAALNQIGIIAIREDKGIKPAFFAMLPANHVYIVRRAPISSKNMASFASLHNFSTGKFNGNHWGEAITVLETISGTPYYINFHLLDVANAFMIGPQGSGKTLLESFLLLLSMKYGGRLIIFDKDKGLEIFVRAMGGTYSTLSAGESTGFAPFQLPDTKDNRYFLTNLLRKIATSNGQGISDEDEDKLKAAVDGAYQLPKEKRILRHIVPFLGMRKSGSLRMRFDNWVNEGNYAWVFDNEVDTLSLNYEVIGFDMTAILSDPSVCTPLYFYLFHCIEKLLDGTRTRIVGAEAWRALMDETFRQKIKDWSSTPRKKEAFLVLDTQAPEDIVQSEIGRKIIQECVFQIYFANPSARYEDYVIHFGLSVKEYEIVKNLDKSSRFFLLKHGKTSVVVRADLADFQDEIAVLSGRTTYSNVLDAIRKEYGDEPNVWLPIYYDEIKKLAAQS